MQKRVEESAAPPKPRHTPGPWIDKIQRSRDGEHLGVIIDSAMGRIGWASLAFVGKVRGEPNNSPENATNARLMALAPEMLELLEEAAIDAEKCVTPSKELVNYDKVKAVIRRARAED